MSAADAMLDADDAAGIGGDDAAGAGEVSTIPTGLRNLRACHFCSLVKTLEQFYESGCDNCPFLEMAENRERVNAFTTSMFTGFISVMDPEHSWVAKWQRIRKMQPGCYAIAVFGRPPRKMVAEVEEQHGVRYVPRDGQTL